MKKRAIAVVILWAMFLCFVWQFRTESYADPFTASQIASTAYAMMQSWGVSFSAGSATASGMNDFMTNQVEDYVNSQGGSIADVFIGNIAVDLAGKLVVGQTMYNSIKNFADWLIDKFSLSSTDKVLSKGEIDGVPIDESIEGAGTWSGVGIGAWFSDYRNPTQSNPYDGYHTYHAMNNNVEITHASCGEGYAFDGSYTVTYDQAHNRIMVNMPFHWKHNGVKLSNPVSVPVILGVAPDNTLSWNGSNYSEPVVLNPGKEWVGDIDGYSQPDTNLEDLLGGIDEAVADNNLDVEGEIIDVPIPPSPQPTVAPDIPLQDVPWEGLNDLIDSSTDSVTESIGEAASDITGAIEGTQEAVESLEETITESLDVPAASEISGRKFDLSTLFPFCIPFDIYRMLQAFDGTAEAPHVQLPFVIQSIGFSYTFDLDFSAFDSVAAILRTVEFIAFGIFLAFSTSKVIRW